MADNRRVDELSLEELEALLEQRRRSERARQSLWMNARRDSQAASTPPHEIARPRRRRREKGEWRKRILMLVEIAAALTLLGIIFAALANLDKWGQEVIQARSATPVPIAHMTTEELPASPFPPSSTINELPGSSFPPEPAPVALGIRLQAVAAVPVPTMGPRSPTRIVIPAINIDWPVVEGDGWEELKVGIGHRIGTANPGERGNMVMSGHNDVYGEPFRDLEIIEVGKEVFVYSGPNAFRYVIKTKRVVAPTDLSPLAPSQTPIVTLITCTPYRIDTMRLIVIGELVS